MNIQTHTLESGSHFELIIMNTNRQLDKDPQVNLFNNTAMITGHSFANQAGITLTDLHIIEQ